MKATRLVFYIFLIPVLGKVYLWIIRPEWTYVSWLWAFIDLPLYLFAALWLYFLCARKRACGPLISRILLVLLVFWEIVLNIILPNQQWSYHPLLSILVAGAVIGFFCLIPGYIVIAKHGLNRYP